MIVEIEPKSNAPSATDSDGIAQPQLKSHVPGTNWSKDMTPRAFESSCTIASRYSFQRNVALSWKTVATIQVRAVSRHNRLIESV